MTKRSRSEQSQFKIRMLSTVMHRENVGSEAGNNEQRQVVKRALDVADGVSSSLR